MDVGKPEVIAAWLSTYSLMPGKRLPDISNNVGPVKLFLNTLLSFHLKEVFSFVFFLSSLHRRPRLARNLAVGFSPT
jgi:hypothetical protein